MRFYGATIRVDKKTRRIFSSCGRIYYVNENNEAELIDKVVLPREATSIDISDDGKTILAHNANNDFWIAKYDGSGSKIKISEPYLNERGGKFFCHNDAILYNYENYESLNKEQWKTVFCLRDVMSGEMVDQVAISGCTVAFGGGFVKNEDCFDFFLQDATKPCSTKLFSYRISTDKKIICYRRPIRFDFLAFSFDGLGNDSNKYILGSKGINKTVSLYLLDNKADTLEQILRFEEDDCWFVSGCINSSKTMIALVSGFTKSVMLIDLSTNTIVSRLVIPFLTTVCFLDDFTLIITTFSQLLIKTVDQCIEEYNTNKAKCNKKTIIPETFEIKDSIIILTEEQQEPYSDESILECAYDLIEPKPEANRADDEKDFYYIYEFKTEIDDGGLAQYFYNSSSDNISELIKALKNRNFTQYAEELDSFVNSNPYIISKDRKKRDFIEYSESADFSEMESLLDDFIGSELDNVLYELAEEITEKADN